jgi:hypothetical protein
MDLGQNYAQMPWAELERLRLQGGDQVVLAPYEHRAYAREVVGANPLMALPMAAMVPAYQAYKALGFEGGGPTDTPPSWDQLRAGLLGIKEGLLGS